MLSRKSLPTAALIVLIPLWWGCTSEVGGPVGVGPAPSAASGGGDLWPGVVLTVWGAGTAPDLVLDDPVRIRLVLAALPLAVRTELLHAGAYETACPELARSYWRMISTQLAAKRGGPRRQITPVNWGKIKIVFT